MKKFNLSVPKPCHENWNQMTPGEKGRFCGACQKTVVDFTHMTDRELADFFKRPDTGAVCGRFHKEQLGREIVVPKKSIPWLRYFIHIAWPAFILMLKSCNIKDRLTGSSSLALSDNRSKQAGINYETMGVVIMPLDSEVDSIPPPPVGGQVEVVFATTTDDDYVKGEVAAVDYKEAGTLVGDIEVTPVEPAPVDSIIVAQSINEIDTAFVEMDTVTVGASYISCTKAYKISCSTPAKVIHTYTNPAKETALQTSAITAYPNPVRAGSILNLKLSIKDRAPISIQLVTANGQRVLHKQLSQSEQGNLVSLPLPAGLPAGVYFLQAVDATGAALQSRVVVNH
ncbi:MAG TPA: T9SS type A sorting domain-containing protein [Flavisolibacter sp.]|nr:T9SS type A sorting domain-containing protein [Flavisolibacter sp.]